MDEQEKQVAMRHWLAVWEKTGPLLERLRCQELRSLKHEEHLRMIDTLLGLGVTYGRPRTSCGLIEQQRWFRKARP